MPLKDQSEVERRLGSMESRMGSIEMKLDRILACLEGGGAPAGRMVSRGNARPATAGHHLTPADRVALSAQDMMRPPSASELLANSARLKKVEVKESFSSPADVEIAAIAKIYTKNGGNLEKIAKDCGADLPTLRKNPPKDEKDFAHKLLQGAYTKPGGEVVIRIGPPSADELKARSAKLKPVESTIRTTSGPIDTDIQCIAGIYSRCNGDLDKIAAVTGANRSLLRKNPPSDADDFARKLLDGLFTDMLSEQKEVSTMDKVTVSASDLLAGGSKLKKTEVKALGSSMVMESDLDIIAGVYRQHNGDLEKISAVCGASVQLMQKTPPADDRDFAKKLLEGLYTDAKSDQLRSQLGDMLRDHLKQQASQLKPTKMKNSFIGPSSCDVDVIAKVYTDSNGDLEQVAELCGASLALLQARPPRDAREFATKLLEGAYVGDRADIARKALRNKFKDQLQERAQGLRRVGTKEKFAGEPSEEELAAIAKIYTDNKGDLATIAKLTGASPVLLEKRKPKDAKDFAKRLLQGMFVGNAADVARSQLHDKLKDQLAARRDKLKRVEVKETASAAPVVSDVEIVARIYTQNGGDLDEIAAICGTDKELLRKNPPDDANDFARKLLQGLYTDHHEDNVEAPMPDEDTMEQDVVKWLEIVSGDMMGDHDFKDWLKDGQVLCKVANRIKPGIVPQVNTSSMPDKQKENIAAFTKACKELGVLEKDIFSIVDLYEGKDLRSVRLCLFILGSAVRRSAPGFKGPYLGAQPLPQLTLTTADGAQKDISNHVRAGAPKVHF